jgi:uncharacterized protein (TIGR02594 family)
MANIPPWLEVMRAITGLHEYENGSNPKIEGMAAFIGRKFPEQASYAAQYTDDSIAWCGVSTDFCLAACCPDGISGPFGATDTDKWMWAQSFASDPGFIHIGSPVPGAIVVMTREGGGHVTMFEEWSGSSIKCRGGNQSNSVNVSTYDPDTVVAYVWPRDYPMPPVPRRTLEEGDSGADVVELQTILGIPVDGEFGPTTDGAVKGFQAGADLDADGVVGEQTWEALDELDARKKAGSEGLSKEEASAIADVARTSPLARYSWDDRGESPIGYVVGMALSYAVAVKRLDEGDTAFEDMAQADREDDDTDVFSWFSDELDDMEWDVSEDGVDSLRALYAIMIGLGMRESSGRYCEGRDMSASNVSSDTAEAGLCQTSWNIRSCASTIPPLLAEVRENPNGFLDAFREDVNPSGSELSGYGSPDGASYQFYSKYAPSFHVYVTAIGLRHLRQHWGPVNRNEVELIDEAYELLENVEGLIEGGIVPPGPEPEPGIPEVDVDVRAVGEVALTVNEETVPALPDPGTPTVAINIVSTGGVRITVDGRPYSESDA